MSLRVGQLVHHADDPVVGSRQPGRQLLCAGTMGILIQRVVPAAGAFWLCRGSVFRRSAGYRGWKQKKVWSMTDLAHRDTTSLFPDLFAWLEGPFVSPRPVAAQPMRMEEHVADGRYVVRAELPGVDPDKDIEVTVAKGILTVRAERREQMQGQHRSEFRYGTFTRHIALPVNADAHDMKATCHWGILEVSVGLHPADEDAAGRRIPVRSAGHDQPA